jgi:hypothetical protein
MRDVLRKRFDWMPANARERAIDEALDALRHPTPFMVEEGAANIRDQADDLAAGKTTSQALAERVFSAMCLRASEGG